METNWAPMKVSDCVIKSFILMPHYKGELPFWVLEHIAYGDNITTIELERKIFDTGFFTKLMGNIYPIYSELYGLRDNDGLGYISSNRTAFDMWSLRNNKSNVYFSIVFDVNRNIFNDDFFEKD